MKYYLIVGEASGDLHASNLMKALKEQDNQAEFRFFGGDLMSAVGGTRGDSAREGSSESGDESSSSDSNSEDDKKQSQHEDVDYDSIRKLIEEYKRKIEELEKLLPEKIIN